MLRLLVLLVLVCEFSHLRADESGYIRVAILGNSAVDDSKGSGIHEDILARLFILIKEKNPAAVFFTGDMTLGIVKGQAGERIPDQADIYGNQWGRQGYVYDSKAYQKQLDSFQAIIKRTLGKNIPFYPVLGYYESLGRDSATLVKQQFGVQNQAGPIASPLAYTIGIGDAFFIVFSTVYYDPVDGKIVQHVINDDLLDWIENTLQANKKKFTYLFAIGTEPAFSTTAAEGNPRGLDLQEDSRNELWRIFTENGVVAYFSSAEHLYDRTNRGGIWQVISGGAGAPLHKREFDRAFYHFLLLLVPKEKGKLPKVQVFDTQGNLDDAFELVPRQYPVYQLRISALSPKRTPAKRKAC